MDEKTIICDTDVIIDYWNQNSNRHSFTKEVLENFIGLENVMLSAMTKMGLIVGAKNKDELNRINKNVHQFNIALINDNITNSAIGLLQLDKLSHGLAIPDAIIAATSIMVRAELFTFNVKDYKFINGLTFFNPVNKEQKQ